MTSNTNRLDGMDMTDVLQSNQLYEALKLAIGMLSLHGHEDDAKKVVAEARLLSASKPAAQEPQSNRCPDCFGAGVYAKAAVLPEPPDVTCARCNGRGTLYAASPAAPSAHTQDERGAFFDVVFDGPPSHVSGRFVEVEDEQGRSFNAGDWIDRGNGLWALRIPRGASTSTNVVQGEGGVLAASQKNIDALFTRVTDWVNTHNIPFEAQNELFGILAANVRTPPAQTANVAPAATVQSGEAVSAYCPSQFGKQPHAFNHQKCGYCGIAAPQSSQPVEGGEATYASSQATNCARCGEHKHTPLRIDWMGGYVCLTCIDKELESRGSAVALDDERAAFEADYAKVWNAALKENGWNADHTADDVKDLREGNTYGEGRDYLNARWEGWQARTASPQATPSVTYEFAYGMSTYEVHGSPEAIKALQRERASNQKIVEGALSRVATATQPAQTERALTAEQITDIRRAAIEECWEAVHAERLEDPSKNADDIAYDIAVTDCENAIRALLTAAQAASGAV
jgi:hypothetical protein